MAKEADKKIDRVKLLHRVLTEFEIIYNSFLRYGLRFASAELVERSIVLNKNIKIRVGRQRISGLVLGFDENGALRLKTSTGVVIVSAGEVSF